jgi:hypothetical protein
MRRLCLIFGGVMLCLPVWAGTVFSATSSCTVDGLTQTWSDATSPFTEVCSPAATSQ